MYDRGHMICSFENRRNASNGSSPLVVRSDMVNGRSWVKAGVSVENITPGGLAREIMAERQCLSGATVAGPGRCRRDTAKGGESNFQERTLGQ
jgi:hypothetical protein